MKHRELTVAAGVPLLAAVAAMGAVGAAGAATAVPKKAVVKELCSIKLLPNRYMQDGMRFDRDVYTVATGGTVQFVMTAPQEGAHTLTVVAAKDLPKTASEAFNCKPCAKLAKAHGADPNGTKPPKLQFLENGVGQNTPPHLDRPGDSGFVPP
jgi:plastocyanin